MSDQPHILIVDDHRDIRELLGKYLDKHGFRTSLAESADAARRLLKGAAVDLVVLDIMMPGEDGLSLCRSLRENSGVPVIFLTAMGEETDRIVGLEMGADDYMTKPFNPREMMARIKAVLRRSASLPYDAAPAAEGKVQTFGDWKLNVSRRELEDAEGVAIPLSTAEFALLNAFLAHPRMVLSRDQLLDLTQGRSADVFDRSIDNQVSRLRKKVEEDPKNPELIKTVWGGGYMFTAEVRTA